MTAALRPSTGSRESRLLGIGTYRPSRVVPNSELVEDGDIVSPGQPLVRLHPQGGAA